MALVSNTGSSFSDEEINKAIKKQLDPFSGSISYLAIAEAAYSVGRRRLATFILDSNSSNGHFGSSASDQIPLLLKMNEDEIALQKVISCPIVSFDFSKFRYPGNK
jgi:hypothetical protein